MNIWYRGPDATGTAATTFGGSRGRTRPVFRHHSHRRIRFSGSSIHQKNMDRTHPLR